MSSILKVGSHWHGFPRRFVIFGDSYSSVGYRISLWKPYDSGAPSLGQPLGVPFPGLDMETWHEPGTPNWVGHLISKYCPEPRFDPSLKIQSPEYQASPIKVYDFAIGGNTVTGIKSQVQNQFIQFMVPAPEGSWSSDDSLFITWVGINDCAYTSDALKQIDILMSLQEDLYTAGARNFMFIDIPPMERSPIGSGRSKDDMRQRYANWNTCLYAGADKLAAAHEDITIMIFSSNRVFGSIVDDPARYNFNPAHAQEIHGSIWNDNLHPTSAVHDIVAKHLADFIGSVEPYHQK